MNRTFKIVFNRVRGKMMVVNEATSSTQRGGRNNVIKCVATAFISTVALALSMNAAWAQIETQNSISTNDDSLSTLLNGAGGYRGNEDKYGKPVASQETLDNRNKNKVVLYTNDVTVTENSGGGSKLDHGWLVLGQNKVLAVGALQDQSETTATLTFTNKTDPVLHGTGLTTSSNGDATVDKGGLAVVAVNGSGGIVVDNAGYFFSQGYSLISTPRFVLKKLESKRYLESLDIGQTTYGSGYNYLFSGSDGQEMQAGQSLMVFQNQNVSKNGQNGIYSIEELPNQKTTSGMYFDTDNMEFISDSGQIRSYQDIQVNLGGRDYLLGNSKILTGTDKTDAYYVTGNQGLFKIQGTTNIYTPNFFVYDGATIEVGTDTVKANAVIGTSSATAVDGATLTIGGTDFNFGTQDKPNDGLVLVAGDLSLAGGNVYFKGDGTVSGAGLVADGALSGWLGESQENPNGTLSINNAILDAANGINLSLDTLTLENGAYVRGGSSKTIEINANKVDITNASLGRDLNGWVSTTGEVAYTEINANEIKLTSGFIIGNEKVTLGATGVSPSLAISATDIGPGGNAAIHKYGIRTNGGIQIGTKENPFNTVSVEGSGLIRADGSRTEKNLEIYANTVEATAKESYAGQYLANNGLALIHTDKIDLSGQGANYAFIKGTKGTEIKNLGDTRLNITLGGSASTVITVPSTYSAIEGQYVSVVGDKGLTLTGGVYRATGINTTTENSIFIDGQDGGVTFDQVWIDAGKVQNGKVFITSNDGQKIKIENSQIRDDVDERGSGTLEVAISGMKGVSTNDGTQGDKSDIYISNTTASDDLIKLGSKFETIFLERSVIAPDDSLEINASSYIMQAGSIGKLASKDTQASLGAVTINANKVQLAQSPINKTGAQILSDQGVTINASESMSMADGAHVGSHNTTTGVDTGSAVSINTGSLTLDGTSYITSEGDVSVGAYDDNGSLKIQMDGGNSVDNPSWIKGNKVSVSGVGVGISGGSISTIGNTGNDINVVGGGKDISISGTDFDAGKGTVNIGAGKEDANSNISISAPSSSGQDSGNLEITANEINIGYNAGGNASVGAGEVEISDATISTSDPTKGSVNIAFGTSADSKLSDTEITGPSINFGVGAGGKVTVTGAGSNLSAENVNISSNGNNQGNAGQVIFEEDASVSADSDFVVGENVDVSVDGGTLSAGQIVNNNKDKVTVTNNDSYLDLENPFDENGELSFDIEEDATGSGLTIEVGDLSKDQYTDLKDQLDQYKDANITAVVGGYDNTQSLEDWDKELGTGTVTASGGVDVSESVNGGREANEIGHGGGSFLVGSGSSAITITGPDSSKGDTGKVTITGSQTEEGAEGFEIVRPSSVGNAGLELEDQTHLTLGNGSSWGGHLSGSIVAKEPGVTDDVSTTDPKVEVIGGRWDIDGGINLGSGDLIIHDKFDSDGSKDAVVNVGKDGVSVGHLEMKGDTTGLTSEGNVTVSNGASISGGNANENSGAHVNIAGNFNVAGGLAMNGNANVKVEGTTEVAGGMIVAESATFDGQDLTVKDGNSQFDGTVNVSGDYTNSGHSTIVTGTTEIAGAATVKDLVVGSAGSTNSPNGSFVAGNTTVSGNFTGHENSSTTINGTLEVTGQSNVGTGASVAVNGDVSLNGGLHLGENATFTNSDDASTTVGGFLIMDEGSKLQAGQSFTLNDKTTIGTGDNGVLNGLISATEEIDLSNASSKDITFSGEGAGTDAHHINVGSGSVTYENGASHVFTKNDSHDEGGIVTGTVNIGIGGSVTMDADQKGSSDKANLYLNDRLELTDNSSRVIVGDVGDQDTSKPGIYLGGNSSFGLNTEGFAAGDSILTDASGNLGQFFVGEGAEINISNWGLGEDGTLKVDFQVLGSEVANLDDYINGLLDSDNVLQDFWYSSAQKELGMDLISSSSVGADDQFSNVVDAVVGSSTENSRKQELINEVFTKGSGFMTQDANGNWVVSGYGNQRLKDVLGLPIAAGAFNIAYDAMTEMNQSMASRMAEPITSHSVSVWADVIATYNTADELFGDSGYSADIYAGVLGADVGITDDWIAGIAFTIGTGDADGEGDTMGIQNDADFRGVSLYTAKTVGKLRASADMGYMKVENDISTNVNYGGKGDTNVFTVGGRLDMTMHQGESFDVTPHFGMRYANFSIDTINGTATNDINVIEMPFGVTVKGKTETRGWKVAPMVDVSVVPQFGDKKAKIWNAGESFKQDVLDPALVRSSVGVSAQKDNFTFGLNYRFGVGGYGRQNHNLNATVRYQF